ncbi:hypothetical protein PHSY_002449 [Pseudozyma hubeiensis SY62]|uniref:Uncharacterized protein n=1 Tax=Pseudozyma hubeiensis (strain SY62) TaxID=1305764 RepID=R9P113_PSEHS|nr:hypothetical protein PHSY_002449 [Pseudozyma hubeiensis SY62]GAC94876.1 hypothetical protein PHSY_002449 [Pseudozyma hubeiensis SY62]
MDGVLRELDGLHTVIDTQQSTLRKYVVALEYTVDGKAERNGSNASSSEKHKSDTLHGILIVTVGCKDAWWSVEIQGSALCTMIRADVKGTGGDYEELTHVECQLFADKVNSAFSRQSIMVGVKKSASLDSKTWTSVVLYIDVEQDPVTLKLRRLTDKSALDRSTNIILLAKTDIASSNAVHSASSRKVDSRPSPEFHQLQRKYEAAQQALREERHKYRSLLAAPSAANARGGGRRPVVGLDPMLQRASQRSQSMLLETPSSPSSSTSIRSGLPSSSGSGGITGPSSDDLQDVPPSQRTLSLVNPTRVRRADPGENQDFVGDSDEGL